MPESTAPETAHYLDLLYAGSRGDSWLIVSWPDPEISSNGTRAPMLSAWYRLDQRRLALRRIAGLSATHDVYLNLGLRRPSCRPGRTRRGTKTDIRSIPGVWIDIDHAGGVHAATNLPSPEELVAFLQSTPFAWSLLIDTGGGIHGYLLFDEPWIFTDRDDATRAQTLLDNFQYTIRRWGEERGWHVDSTADLTRVLRPPGTINHKNGGRRGVVILAEDPTRYAPSDLEQAPWLLHTPQGRSARVDTDDEAPPAHLEPIVDGCAWRRHCQNDAASLVEPDWYAMLSILGRCENGDELAHTWSKTYPGYSPEETDAKLTHALGAGPRTCANLATLTGNRFCGACPSWGHIKSPITLGYGRHDRSECHASQDGDGEASSEEDSKPPRKSQATLLVEMAADAELWHTPEGDAYATISIDGHHEHWSVNSKGFRRWLKRLYYLKTHATPSSQAIQDAIGVLEGQAQYDGSVHPINTRLAEHDGKLYLDLANERWEAIEIDRQGWRVVTEPPVKFRRTRGMLPLPYPVAGGTLDELRGLLNIHEESAWVLVKAWLVQALRPCGPYPVVVLHGEQGSAKSTTSRMLRGLIDPNTALLRAEPREGRDLMIAATNGWLIALDNLSHLPSWLSDAICRLATGGGFSTRELYSDAEEVIFSAQRPVLLNGIEELATRGDLLDRTIILYSSAIPEDQRKPEAVLWRDFEAKRPTILGALLGAVSEALRNVDRVTLQRLPRMADFALWASAAASKLGFTVETFLEAYAGNREAANELTLEASILTPYIKEIAAAGFTGTATELLQRLNDHVDDATTRQKAWPKNPRTLSNALRRIVPNLRAVGVEVSFPGGRRKGRRITLEQTGNVASSSSSSSSSQANQSDKRGRWGDANAGGDATLSSSLPGGDDSTRDGDDREDASQTDASHWKYTQEDDGDDRDAKKPLYSNDDEEVIDL